MLFVFGMYMFLFLTFSLGCLTQGSECGVIVMVLCFCAGVRTFLNFVPLNQILFKVLEARLSYSSGTPTYRNSSELFQPTATAAAQIQTEGNQETMVNV